MTFSTAFTWIIAAIFVIALIFIIRRSYCPRCGSKMYKEGEWYVCTRCKKAFKFPFMRGRKEL